MPVMVRQELNLIIAHSPEGGKGGGDGGSVNGASKPRSGGAAAARSTGSAPAAAGSTPPPAAAAAPATTNTPFGSHTELRPLQEPQQNGAAAGPQALLPVRGLRLRPVQADRQATGGHGQASGTAPGPGARRGHGTHRHRGSRPRGAQTGRREWKHATR
ncbi:hypothetical protein MRX96_043654 [Rhipicephalus microplus]